MNSESKFDKISTNIVGYGLLLTGFAKLLSTFGNAHVLDALDPILEVKFRVLFGLCGSAEIIIALVILIFESAVLKMWLINGMFGSFLMYRIAVFTGGISAITCPCLGNLYGVIPVKRSYIDFVLEVFLVYGLVIGAYLFYKIIRGCNVAPSHASSSENNC
jgi:hypothetical protein